MLNAEPWFWKEDNICKNGLSSKSLRFQSLHIVHKISRAYCISFCLWGSRRDRHIRRLSAFNKYRPVSHSQNPCWVWISVRKGRELDSSSLASLWKSTQSTAGDRTGSHPCLSVCLSLLHTRHTPLLPQCVHLYHTLTHPCVTDASSFIFYPDSI